MFEKVRDVIVDTLGCEAEAVTMEATLTEDLGLDSIDAVELNIALEDALGTAISDEALKEMKTVGDIVSYLEQNALEEARHDQRRAAGADGPLFRQRSAPHGI